MCGLSTAPTTMTLCGVEVTLAVQNLYNSHNLANIAHINYNMYTWTGKHTRPVISTVVSNLKDFSMSQAVTYNAKVK